MTTASECVSDIGKSQCAELGGECLTERDGYYIVSALCVTIGAILLVTYVTPTAKRLQGTFSLALCGTYIVQFS